MCVCCVRVHVCVRVCIKERGVCILSSGIKEWLLLN